MKYIHKIVSRETDETKIEITIDYSEFKKTKDEAFQYLASEVRIPGFRPGKGPKEAIEKQLGTKLLDETIKRLLPIPAVEILEKEDIKPITRVNYDLQDLSADKGVTYIISFAEYPEVKLGDLSKIKVQKDAISVKVEDIDAVIKNLVRSSLPLDTLKKYKSKTKDSGSAKKVAAKGKSSGKKENKENKSKDQKPAELTKDNIEFDLSDDLIKELKYEKEQTLEEMRNKVKERLIEIKERQAEEDYMNNLLLEAVKSSEVNIPKPLIDNEVHMMEHDFEDRLKELKLDKNVFLTTQNTTLEKKKEEWKETAKNKIKTELVLYKIASEHELDVDEAAIDAEINSIKDEKVRDSYQTSDARSYLRSMLTKRKAIDKLQEVVEGSNKTSKSKKKAS